MRIDPVISGCSIVLLGRFDPAIFQPAWLFANGIEPSANNPEIRVIHGDISHFVVETRNYTIQQDRFILDTFSGPWVLISDIVSRIFLNFFTHTPV